MLCSDRFMLCYYSFCLLLYIPRSKETSSANCCSTANLRSTCPKCCARDQIRQDDGLYIWSVINLLFSCHGHSFHPRNQRRFTRIAVHLLSLGRKSHFSKQLFQSYYLLLAKSGNTVCSLPGY